MVIKYTFRTNLMMIGFFILQNAFPQNINKDDIFLNPPSKEVSQQDFFNATATSFDSVSKDQIDLDKQQYINDSNLNHNRNKRGLIDDLRCVIGTYCPWFNPARLENTFDNELYNPSINGIVNPEINRPELTSSILNDVQEINLIQPNDAVDTAINLLLPEALNESRQDLFPVESVPINKEKSRKKKRILKKEFWSLSWNQLEDYRERLEEYILSLQNPTASFITDISLGFATDLVIENPENALNILDAYMLVAKTNGAKKHPDQMTKEFTKAEKLIAASCTFTNSVLIVEPDEECAKIALKSIKDNDKKTIATPSQILTANNYYLSDPTTFNSIVLKINKKNLPKGAIHTMTLLQLVTTGN